ncbi:MAG: hypothetical protein ACI4PZ_02175 [Akkermansia sp.]
MMILSAQTFNPALYKNLLRFMELAPGASSPALVYGGEDMGTLQGVKILSFNQITELLASV